MNRFLRAALILIILTSGMPLAASDGWFENDSLRYKIGQMLIFGFLGNTVPDQIKTEIHEYNVGGVLLYRVYDNLQYTSQIQTLIADLQAAAPIPLLIATDQEGGRVTNLRASNGFENSPSAYELGRLTDETTTRDVGSKFATWFSGLGINTDFAPVVDLRLQPDNVIGDRSYGAHPDTVFRNAYWFIDEFRKRDLITSVKHFPGHGSSIGDSHLGFTDVTDTWSEIELLPFQSLIDSGYVDMVMTAHIFNADLDPLHPATLSYSTITELLRDSLAFDGVVVTDAMLMKAVTDHYGVEESITMAVNAGCDLILYNWDDDLNDNRLAPLFVNHVEQEVLAGTIPMQRIEESYRRILRLKSRLPANTLVPDHEPIVPKEFDVACFPNPFNSRTNIEYRLENPSEVRGTVYNLLGRPVRALIQGIQPAGNHRLLWDATDDVGNTVPSGPYLFRLLVRQEHEMSARTLKLYYIE